MLTVPEGRCQYALIRMSAEAHRMRSRLILGTNDQEHVALRGATNDSRWPCSFTLTVFQPGEGAPASLSTYTIGKK